MRLSGGSRAAVSGPSLALARLWHMSGRAGVELELEGLRGRSESGCRPRAQAVTRSPAGRRRNPLASPASGRARTGRRGRPQAIMMSLVGGWRLRGAEARRPRSDSDGAQSQAGPDFPGLDSGLSGTRRVSEPEDSPWNSLCTEFRVQDGLGVPQLQDPSRRSRAAGALSRRGTHRNGGSSRRHRVTRIIQKGRFVSKSFLLI